MTKRPEVELSGDENKHDDEGIDDTLIWMEMAAQTKVYRSLNNLGIWLVCQSYLGKIDNRYKNNHDYKKFNQSIN
jgi:hypothetical protein